MNRNELAERVAEQMTEAVDIDSLVDAFYTDQLNWYCDDAEDAQLLEDANSLGVLDEDEILEIEENGWTD